MVSRELLPVRVIVTWTVLVLAAVVGPLLTLDSHGGTLAAVVVLAIATVKVRLVGLDFMELRHAPWELRTTFECYCVAMWMVLSGLFVFA
ncbi:cytochrome C oxidase subunit IV family protein [Rhodococcus sp. NPDC058521]|uniref:cytochrome C oxidase subunit IV family protein n=1 Tax=Rhodococcus sp. NPDC058521 TaxID=3346536 RepID=UPI0036579F8F